MHQLINSVCVQPFGNFSLVVSFNLSVRAVNTNAPVSSGPDVLLTFL